jgi:hypothetical protein
MPSDPAMFAAFIGLIGAVVGGVIGLIAGVLTTKLQLKHDSKQRDREREMSLRINVYLQAADSVVRSQGLVATLANPDMPEAQAMATYQSDLSAIGKILVVGTEETVKAITQFSNAFNAATLEMFLRRASLAMLDVKIKDKREWVEASAKNRDDFFQKWIEALKTKEKTHLPPDYYQQNHKNWSENYLEWSKELTALEKQVLPARLELMRFGMELCAALGGFTNPAVIAIRKELELPLNADEYLKLATESGIVQRAAIEGFMKRLTQMATEADGGEPATPQVEETATKSDSPT